MIILERQKTEERSKQESDRGGASGGTCSGQPTEGLQLQPSRPEPQPELPPLALLADLVEEPRDGLLLDEPGAVEVLAHRQRELLLADAALADDAVHVRVASVVEVEIVL